VNKDKYLEALKKIFSENAKAQLSERMSAYLRNQFKMYGIPTPFRRRLQKEFWHRNGYPERDQVNAIAEKAWKYPEREFQHFAIELLIKYKKDYRKEDIGLFEKLITEKSWWDTVDGIAGWILGDYFKLYPENINPVTRKWMDSGNMWLQRSALLFQLKYKRDTDFNLLTKYILELRHSKEFFIQKAIGWVLREYSKTCPEKVLVFVKSNQLAPLSEREALKVLRKKGIIS
jgi:3-methyladenine DNA glycosylase AlkD